MRLLCRYALRNDKIVVSIWYLVCGRNTVGMSNSEEYFVCLITYNINATVAIINIILGNNKKIYNINSKKRIDFGNLLKTKNHSAYFYTYRILQNTQYARRTTVFIV